MQTVLDDPEQRPCFAAASADWSMHKAAAGRSGDASR
jgi:hypothetical protein